MKAADLSELARVTDAIYQKEQLVVRDILAAEAQLRRKLAQLDQSVSDARAAPEQLDLMRPFGADVLWEAWAGRTRRQLNMELAQVLAQKLHMMDRVRVAFGKRLVAQTLETTAKEQVVKARAQMLQDQAMRR